MKITDDQINIGIVRMVYVKTTTIRHYFPERRERKRYYGCKYTFDFEENSSVPIRLHVWVGRNHKYLDKYHKVFDIPEPLRLPLIKTD